MIVRATFREIGNGDLSIDCPFLPEPEEFDVHVRSIAEDIAAIDGVNEVSQPSESEILIESEVLTLEVLKNLLKTILQHHWQFARISSIEIV